MRVQGSGFGVQEGSSAGGRALLLTPPGGAAIAVVRLVGSGVGAFLARYFSRPVADGRCVHGTLRDGERVIDDPVVVTSGGGRVADINLHGGPWVVRSVLELARRSGFEVVERPALPLPPDAVDGDTELGREVLQYLPMARTELALRVLLAQEAAWAAGRASGGGDLRAVLDDRSLYWLLHPPRVAIVGVPNVGKSTLANQLFAQERSITADVPGTTRDWVGEIANVDGLPIMLVDTPGLRETADAIEREAIELGRGEVRRADLVVVVLDPTQAPDAQRDLMRAHPHALYVVNKSDRRATWETPDGPRVLPTVATTGKGVDTLTNAIKREFLGTAEFEMHRPRCWTERQRKILEQALGDPHALDEL
jgi:tRNA modification GTPase